MIHSLNRINEQVDESHLQDPLAVLQGFKERFVGVRGRGTGSARLQQFLEGGLGLPRVRKLHRHQLAVQHGVQLEALKKSTVVHDARYEKLRSLWLTSAASECHREPTIKS